MKTIQFPDLVKPNLLHYLSNAELEDIWISSKSRWPDFQWCFDNPTPGAKKSTSSVGWNIGLSDGTDLTHENHAVLLDWLRRLVWSLHVEPANGVGMKPGSFGSMAVGIRRFALWLVANHYCRPDQLDHVALTSFVEDLPDLLADESDDDENITQNMARLPLMIPVYLWRQRHILAKAGIAPIPEEPYQGRTIADLAAAIAKKPGGWIRPIPDEVIIPILNRAAWFMGKPAEDILKLQSVCLDAYNDTNKTRYLHMTTVSKHVKVIRQREAAARFQFSVIDGESEPWHAPLTSKEELSELRPVGLPQQARRLVVALRSACYIVLHSSGGFRISEIAGLPRGIDPATGIPSCVSLILSPTGLYEKFVIRTVLSKTEETPRNVDWVIGMRPVGTTDVPIAVRAIQLLNKLFEPYCCLAKTDRLFISFSSGRGLPKSAEGVGPISAERLASSVRDFVADWVDLSQLQNESHHKVEDNDLVAWRESRGRILKTHMFRKAWAQFALAVDPRLLPVIQMHFHHLSLSMTEKGYLGNNPIQLEALDKVSRQQRNLLIWETVFGENKLAGKMGKRLEEKIKPLRSKVYGLPIAQAWKEVVHFGEENEMLIWFAPHGKCMPLIPTEMRCHASAGTSSWLNRMPNYSTREPALCVGCSCFILDRRHKEFWEQRYLANFIALKKNDACTSPGAFRVIKERAVQAGRLLRKMGIDTRPLDIQIQSALEGTAYG